MKKVYINWLRSGFTLIRALGGQGKPKKDYKKLLSKIFSPIFLSFRRGYLTSIAIIRM